MVFLKCVWLLVASLCAASRHIAVAVDGSDATSEQANNITLRFSLRSNSTAECDAVLTNPGVAVSYRTDLDSNNWIPLGPLITIQQAAAASSCVNRPITRELQASNVTGAIQFRFHQEEHAGGYCSCWGINDLAVYNGMTPLPTDDESDTFCSDRGANQNMCGATRLHVLCAGSASVPRRVLTKAFTLSPSTRNTDTLNCSGDQLVDKDNTWQCDNTSSNTSYVSISFQLHLSHSCNRLDNLDEGIELAVRSSRTDGWVPLRFYGLINKTGKTTHRIALGTVNSNKSKVILRGYSVPIVNVTLNTTQNITTVRVCGEEFFERGVQFRWLQTVRVPNLSKDVWTLDNVTVAANCSGRMTQVFSEDFENGGQHNFSVKAGNVTDKHCSLSGHSLVFGLGKPSAELVSRIGVTPPLDLSLCAEGREPTRPPTTSTPSPSPSPSPPSLSPSPSPSSFLSSSSPPSLSPSPSSSSSLSSPSLSSPSPPSLSPSPSPSSFLSSSSPPSLSPSPSPSSFLSSSSPPSLSPSPSPSSSLSAPSPPSLSPSPFSSSSLSSPSPPSSSPSPSPPSLSPSPSPPSLSPSSSFLPSPSPSPVPSTVEEETQKLIDSDPDYSRIQNLPPNEAIKELAWLTSTDSDRENVDETVILYLMADILNKIETNISIEFSENFISAGSNTVERVISRGGGEEPNTIAGSSLLNVMDQFALIATSNSGFLKTDNIDMSVQLQDEGDLSAQVQDDEGEEILGISRDDSRIILPRELIRNIPMTIARRRGGRRVQIGSFLFNNMTGLLPDTLPGEDSNSTNASRLAGPILSSALQCDGRVCNTRNITLRRPVRIVIAHSESMQEGEESVCVFWEFEPSQSGRLMGGNWATDGCNRNPNLSNSSVTVCECNHLTHFAILLSPGEVVASEAVLLSLQVIGIVGVTISLVAMAITILTFICLRSLWSMRSYIHINLCISLMVAQVIFIAGVEPRGSVVGCQVVAVLLHYFFMVTFMWMLMEGVVLYVALVRVFAKYQARYIAAFTIVSYGLPLLYMGVTIPLGFLLDNGPHYGDVNACWLRYDTHFVWAFIVPVIIVVLVNVGFFIMAITIMYRHHRRQRCKSRVAEVKYWLISSISLLVVMGITWIIGIFTFGSEALLPIAYIFTIFIAFQGAIIFILFVVLSKQVREAYRKWWKVKVTKSELLSKYFGEKFTVTTSTGMEGRSGSISSSDHSKLKSVGSMTEKKNQCLEDEKAPPIALQPLTQGNVFNIVFLPQAAAVTEAEKGKVALENGGLERHEKAAFDNEYTDIAQLQAATSIESSASEYMDTSEATVRKESSVSELMDTAQLQGAMNREGCSSEDQDSSQPALCRESSVSELMDTAQLQAKATHKTSSEESTAL